MASDSFTGADGTALATHDANWTFSKGDAISNLTLNSNQLRCAGYRELTVYYSGSTTDYAKATMKANMDDASQEAGPAVRMTSGDSGYAIYFNGVSGGNWTGINLSRNGTYLTFRSGTWAVASDHTLEIIASGTGATVTITIKCDGATVGAVYEDTAAGRLTSGSCGIKIVNNAASAFNFIDDWTDTAAAAAPILVFQSAYKQQ